LVDTKNQKNPNPQLAKEKPPTPPSFWFILGCAVVGDGGVFWVGNVRNFPKKQGCYPIRKQGCGCRSQGGWVLKF